MVCWERGQLACFVINFTICEWLILLLLECEVSYICFCAVECSFGPLFLVGWLCKHARYFLLFYRYHCYFESFTPFFCYGLLSILLVLGILNMTKWSLTKMVQLFILLLSQPNSCIDFDSRPTHGDWVWISGGFPFG